MPARPGAVHGGLELRQLAPLECERLRTTRGGEVWPGIIAIPEPGQTPGHTGWLVSSEGDALLIWGDIVHWQGTLFARPDAGLAVHVDGPQAIATRQELWIWRPKTACG